MEGKELTNREAVGIGVKVGVIMLSTLSLVYLLYNFSYFSRESFVDLVLPTLLAVFLPGLILGIPAAMAGAFIGKLWRKTRRTAWVGALIGCVLVSAPATHLSVFITIMYIA